MIGLRQWPRRNEREAIARGGHGAWLETFEFQARGFYERLGYTCFGELPNDPVGSRYFMKKALQKNYPYTIDNGQGERLTFMGAVNEGGPRALADGVAQPGSGPPMHVHYLQEEGVRVVRGRMGHQVLGGPQQFAGPGELVVWPAGTAHKWWNAGNEELHMSGWCSPPGNIEFFLSTLFASTKANGGRRPDLFDVAFLITRYRTEYAMLEMPTIVRRVVIPIVYVLGTLLGKYAKFKDAPEPMMPVQS